MSDLALTDESAGNDGSFLADLWTSERRAPKWEVAILTIWFMVNYVPLPEATPILYLCVLYFLGQLVLSYKIVVPVIIKAWPLLLLPIWGFFSFIWSPYPSQAFRSGLLFLLTPLVIYVIVARIHPKQIQRALLFAGMLATLLTLTTWADIPLGGPYSHKNYLAVHMLFCLLLSLSTLLDREEPVLLRLMTMPFILLCPIIIVLSQSATSLVMMLVGVAGMLAVRFLIVDLGRIKHMRTTILMFGSIVVLTIAMAILSMPENQLVQEFFDATGKDSSFSGRTAIWKAGKEVSAEHPVLGVGLEGFWQYDVGMAQTLVENDYKKPGTKLGFHSAFVEVQVHLGYVGLALFWLIVIWCIFNTFRRWAFDPTLNSSAFLLMSLIILGFSFTEGWLWGTFNAVVNIYYISALATMGAMRRDYLGKARVVIGEP